MIKNAAALTEIRHQWGGVGRLRVRVQRASVGSAGAENGWVPTLADIAHNLPFLHACSVLYEVLEQLRDEGIFQCKARTLGALVKASNGALEWVDLPGVEQMVRDRNALAHRGTLLSRAKCWEYLDLVERQFLAWGILPRA